MVILRIEHTVPDFEDWKKTAFDNDPLDRKAAGVVRHRILRPIDNPNYVLIDLEFKSLDEAEAMLAKLKVLWGNVQDHFGWAQSPTARIVEVAEDKNYTP